MSGRATPELLSQLWGSVLAGLVEKLHRPKPSSENLMNARNFLKDSRYSPEYTPALNKRLGELHEAYMVSLKKAMEHDKPPPAALKEAREFLKQNKREMDIAEASKRLNAIPSTPFPQ
jgi:hypothetical protein